MFGIGEKKKEPEPRPQPHNKISAGDVGRDMIRYGKQSMTELRQDISKKRSVKNRSSL